MKIKPLRNYSDYVEAKKELESIIKSDIESEEGQKAEILSILVEHYEKKMKPSTEDLDLEPLIDYVYDLVKNTSSLEKNYTQKGVLERGLKLSEETGELSAEILKYIGYKKSDLSKSQIEYNILLESTDCLIMIFDIMINMGFPKKDIIDMGEKQVNKWLNNIKK